MSITGNGGMPKALKKGLIYLMKGIYLLESSGKRFAEWLRDTSLDSSLRVMLRILRDNWQCSITK